MTYSEWVGKGPQQKSVINVNPVSREIAIATGITVASLKSAAGDAVQLSKETTDINSGTCDKKYPVEIVACLGIVIAALLVPLGIAAFQIKQLLEEQKQTAEKVGDDSNVSSNLP